MWFVVVANVITKTTAKYPENQSRSMSGHTLTIHVREEPEPAVDEVVAGGQHDAAVDEGRGVAEPEDTSRRAPGSTSSPAR